MSYATTGREVVRCIAFPIPVPWRSAGAAVYAGVIPFGQLVRICPLRLMKTIATCPGGIAPLGSGAYVIVWPEPDGMRAAAVAGKFCPARSMVIVTGSVHVF